MRRVQGLSVGRMTARRDAATPAAGKEEARPEGTRDPCPRTTFSPGLYTFGPACVLDRVEQ